MNSRSRVSMDTALFISASSHASDLGRCLERNPKSQHALSWVGEGFNEPPESVETVWGKLGGNVRICSFFANIDLPRH